MKETPELEVHGVNLRLDVLSDPRALPVPKSEPLLPDWFNLGILSKSSGTRCSPLGTALALGSHPSSGSLPHRGSGPRGLSIVLYKGLKSCCSFVALVALIFCKGAHIVGFDATSSVNWELTAAEDTQLSFSIAFQLHAGAVNVQNLKNFSKGIR